MATARGAQIRAALALRQLIDLLRASHRCFRRAADALAEGEVYGFFNGYAHERARFVDELEAQFKEYRGLNLPPHLQEPCPGGAEEAHHVAILDRETLICSCERCEDSTRIGYEGALKQEWPAPLGKVITRHLNRIRVAHQHVRDLCNQVRREKE